MGISPFFRIIFKNTISHKSRFIGSILGAVIAVSFITGSFLTAEAMATRYFEENLDERLYHLEYTRLGNTSSLPPPEEFEEQIMDISGIKICGLSFGFGSMFSDGNNTMVSLLSPTPRGKEILIGRDIDLFDDGFKVTILSHYAESRSLEVGDNFTLTANPDSERLSSYYPGPYSSDRVLEFEFMVGEILEDDNRWGGASRTSYDYESVSGFTSVYLSYDGLMKRLNRLGLDQESIPFFQTAYIKVDNDFLSNKEDIISSIEEIDDLEERVSREMSWYGYQYNDSVLETEYGDYTSWSLWMKFLFFSLSLPLILLSFYLLLVGARIGLDRKRREIGLLKSKGASKVQVFFSLLFESLLHGFIGGGLGILIGILISKGFIAYTFRGENLGDLFRADTTIPGIGLIIFSVIGIPILFLALRIVPSFKLSKIPLLETIKRTPQQTTEKNYRGIWDSVVLIVTFSVMIFYSLINSITISNFTIAIIYMIMLVLMPVLILFFPFFLILSLTRVVIIGIPKVMEFISKISDLFVEELGPLISSNLKFNRRKTAVMALLVATSIAFGTLVGIADGSYKNNIDELIHSSLPTDLMVLSSESSEEVASSLSGLDGIEKVSYISLDTSVEVDRSENYFDWRTKMYSFHPIEYEDNIRIPDDIYLEGGGVSSIENKGGVPSVLINRAFKRKYDLDVGDDFRFNPDPEGYEEYDPYRERPALTYPNRVRIGGMIEYLPGMRSSLEVDSGISDPSNINIDIESKRERPAFFIDINSLDSSSDGVGIYLVDITGNEREVSEEILSMKMERGSLNIFSRSDFRERVMDSPLYLGLKVVLDIEYFYVLVSVIVGLSLMMVVSTASRRREFAEILSRGASRDQILKMILSEGIVILIAGLVVGSGVGVLSAFSFEPLISGEFLDTIEMANMEGGYYSSEVVINIGSGIIFPPVVLLLHLITILSVIITSLVTSYLASRVDISNTLRLRTS